MDDTPYLVPGGIGFLDLTAHVRGPTGMQRLGLGWILDSRAAQDMMCEGTVAANHVRTKLIDVPRAFSGVGGIQYADRMCQGINMEELGTQLSTFIIRSDFHLMSVGRRCQHDGLDLV